nr:hypothetical protein 2 [Lactuca sativa marnavirus]
MPAYWSNKFSLQSEDTTDTLVGTPDGVAAAIEESETVRFVDNAVGAVLNLPTTDNPVARVDDTDDLTLGRFFARPTLINTQSWSTSDVAGVLSTFDPWTGFLSSPAIRKKLDNFAYLRGNLHVKVLVNGTPFQYGALRYCYEPYGSGGKYRPNGVTVLTNLIPFSQFPGIFVSPQANAGGEMTLPFFYLKNWLDITSAAEVARMGKFSQVIYAPLRLAVAGGSTSVTMRTYAWMTDVQLMGSTAKLSLQSDEYGTGPVSLPASAIAAAAGALTKVPIIGKFARATEIGAGAVSKMAALFGYTNVPVIADVHAYVPSNAPHLASTQVGQPVQKLTVDPKQELSIDSSFHSLGNADELAISYLKKKESYFGATSWSTADAAGTQLFNMRVNPNLDSNIPLLNTSSVQRGTRSYQVPLSYFGRLFQYWRGDIRVRVKVVCTKFHKGRLKISYDPVADISATDPPENVVYTQILDIGEHDDVTFHIPYHQPEGWRSVDRSLSTNWTPGNPLAPRPDFDNGTLTIRVLNTLTAPAASTVSLLFFVSGGDNFEYAAPAATLAAETYGAADAGYPTMFALQSEDLTDVVTTDMVIGTKAAVLPERYSVNMGECVSSLRSLLHRQTLISTRAATDSLTGNFAAYTFLKRMPPSPGYDTTAAIGGSNVLAASGNSPFSFCNMSPITWVTACFCGYRGSVNYTVTPSANGAASLDRVNVFRGNDNNAAADFAIVGAQTLSGTTGSSKASFYNNWSITRWAGVEGAGGAAITATRTNGSVMFNFPNYNKNNFAVANPLGFYLGTTADDTRREAVGVEMWMDSTATPASRFSVSIYAGAGPDFNPVFFLCCPTIDYLSGTVTSV